MARVRLLRTTFGGTRNDEIPSLRARRAKQSYTLSKFASSAFGLLAMTMLAMPSAHAAIAYVQSASDDVSAASDTLAFGSNNAAGNTIIVAVRQGGTAVGGGFTPVTVSDTRGNSYVQVATQDSTTDHRDFIFAAHNIAAGANTVTCAFTRSETMRWAIHEYSGLQAIGSVDQIASTTGASAAPDSGNITTTQADVLLFGMASVNGAETFTAGGSYTVRETAASKFATEDRIVSATGTYSAGFSLSGSDTWAALVVAFKASDGLIVHWRLDDAAGGSAVDSSGYANTGTLNGNTAWTSGLRGGAANFDGTSDSISTISSKLDDLSVFTVCAWVYPTGGWPNSFPNIFSTLDGTSGWDLYLTRNHGDPPGFGSSYMNSGAGFVYKEQRLAAIQQDVWNHLCASQNGDGTANITLYLNGFNAGFNASGGAGARASDAGNTKLIGSEYGNNYEFLGKIDDVRIYKRILTAVEIQGIFAGGRTTGGVVQNGGMNQ